jgi:hypothetical protein
VCPAQTVTDCIEVTHGTATDRCTYISCVTLMSLSANNCVTVTWPHNHPRHSTSPDTPVATQTAYQVPTVSCQHKHCNIPDIYIEVQLSNSSTVHTSTAQHTLWDISTASTVLEHNTSQWTTHPHWGPPESHSCGIYMLLHQSWSTNKS